MIPLIRSSRFKLELRFRISRQTVKYQGYRPDYEGGRVSLSGMDVHRDPSSLRRRSPTSGIGASASSSFELWMEQADVEHPQSREKEQGGRAAGVTKGDRGGRVNAAFQYWRQPVTLPERRDVSRLVSGTLMPPPGSRNECVCRAPNRTNICAYQYCFYCVESARESSRCLDIPSRYLRVAFASAVLHSLEMEEWQRSLSLRWISEMECAVSKIKQTNVDCCITIHYYTENIITEILFKIMIAASYSSFISFFSIIFFSLQKACIV